jgi:rhamnosyltransferase
MNAKQNKVVCVLVTYNPDYDVLDKCIKSIHNQIYSLVLVDNSEKIPEGLYELADRYKKITLIVNLENLGIAKAQNIGVKKAIELGGNFILFSDQDTWFPLGFIENMLFHYIKFGCDPTALIAPNFINKNNQNRNQGFIKFDSFYTKKINASNPVSVISQAISSGSLIPISSFELVGFMDESLFIDWVDLEWCWRATANGLQILGCNNILIEHDLGDSNISILGSTYPIRSPIRHYYIIRNGINLSLRCKSINLKMKSNIFLKCLIYYLAYLIFGHPRLQNLFFCSYAIIDGLANKLGKFKRLA